MVPAGFHLPENKLTMLTQHFFFLHAFEAHLKSNQFTIFTTAYFLEYASFKKYIG